MNRLAFSVMRVIGMLGKMNQIFYRYLLSDARYLGMTISKVSKTSCLVKSMLHHDAICDGRIARSLVSRLHRSANTQMFRLDCRKERVRSTPGAIGLQKSSLNRTRHMISSQFIRGLFYPFSQSVMSRRQ
jgi:hypothetical protein